MQSCETMTSKIRSECVAQGVVNEDQIHYVIATAMWETSHTCLPVREAYWCTEKWRERHLRYYPYYGRGYVQLTWEANYEKFGKLLGLDLLNHPDLALLPDNAIKILVTGMKNGLFTGYGLDDFFTLNTTPDFAHARRIINGMDKAHTIASMAQHIHYA